MTQTIASFTWTDAIEKAHQPQSAPAPAIAFRGTAGVSSDPSAYHGTCGGNIRLVYDRYLDRLYPIVWDAYSENSYADITPSRGTGSITQFATTSGSKTVI